MFAEERKKTIMDNLIENGRITVNELSEIFKVSRATIRRDLQELEDNNLLIRSHGGAILKVSTQFEPSFAEKITKNKDEKIAIGQKAASLIQDNETILLDAGSTTSMIIPYLTAHNLTIVANSVHILQQIAYIHKYQLIAIGGQLRPNTQAFVGPITEDTLRTLYVDKAFIGANGIDKIKGITTPDLVEAHVKSIMVNIAREVYIVADHTKFNKSCFAKITSFDKIKAIIVDNSISNDDFHDFEQMGVKIIKANGKLN